MIRRTAFWIVVTVDSSLQGPPGPALPGGRLAPGPGDLAGLPSGGPEPQREGGAVTARDDRVAEAERMARLAETEDGPYGLEARQALAAVGLIHAVLAVVDRLDEMILAQQQEAMAYQATQEACQHPAGQREMAHDIVGGRIVKTLRCTACGDALGDGNPAP